MSEHNPELKPIPHAPPNANIWPTASDFIEHPEAPRAVQPREPLPLWLYLICGVALFMAGSSFTGFSSFGEGLYDQGAGGVTTSLASTQAAAPEDTPLTLGKKVYGGNCANCHQANGAGQPGSYPPLVGSEYVNGPTDRLFAIMLHGLSGPVTVAGGSYGSQQMPGWSTNLSDKQISEVMTYIRGSWGNKAPEVKAEDVSAARAKLASHGAPYSMPEIMAMPGK